MSTVLANFKRHYYIYICLILGIVCLVHFFSSRTYYPYTYCKKEAADQGIFNSLDSRDTINKKELLVFLFDKRQDHYFNTVGTLEDSVNKMAFLVLIAIMLLYFHPSDIELFGVKIPNLAIYIILPVCILYYWLLFGFSLFNALASREALFHLSRGIEKEYFTDKKDHLERVYSTRCSLEDVGIVDAWSNVFFGFYEDDYDQACKLKDKQEVKFNTANITVAVGLFIIFGGLQGLAMGSAQAMIYYYKKRLVKKSRKTVVVLEMVLFGYFILSHIAFFVAMPYSTLYLASIWFISAIFFHFTLRAFRQQAAAI